MKIVGMAGVDVEQPGGGHCVGESLFSNAVVRNLFTLDDK